MPCTGTRKFVCVKLLRIIYIYISHYKIPQLYFIYVKEDSANLVVVSLENCNKDAFTTNAHHSSVSDDDTVTVHSLMCHN